MDELCVGCQRIPERSGYLLHAMPLRPDEAPSTSFSPDRRRCCTVPLSWRALNSCIVRRCASAHRLTRWRAGRMPPSRRCCCSEETIIFLSLPFYLMNGPINTLARFLGFSSSNRFTMNKSLLLLMLAALCTIAPITSRATESKYAIKFENFCNIKNFTISGEFAYGSELGCSRAGQSLLGAAMSDGAIIFSTIGGDNKVCMHRYRLADRIATISCTNGQGPVRTRMASFVFGNAADFPAETGEYNLLPDVEDF